MSAGENYKTDAFEPARRWLPPNTGYIGTIADTPMAIEASFMFEYLLFDEVPSGSQISEINIVRKRVRVRYSHSISG